jgi:hypothetical protein
VGFNARALQTSIQLPVSNHQAARGDALLNCASVMIGVAPMLSEGAERGGALRSRVGGVTEKVWGLSFDRIFHSLHPIVRTKIYSAAAAASSIQFFSYYL